jgi:hypothetical protein
VTRGRGRRRRKLLDDIKERRGYSHLKEEAIDRTVWRAGFGRGFGTVVRQTAKWMADAQKRAPELFTLLVPSLHRAIARNFQQKRNLAPHSVAIAVPY